MASTSSINSSCNTSHNNHHNAPNPPPRTHSRPNQPPPPPPLPLVPPVPPTRDSSAPKASIPNLVATRSGAAGTFLSPFLGLFKPIADLPPPEIFLNKPKTYPSQRKQQTEI